MCEGKCNHQEKEQNFEQILMLMTLLTSFGNLGETPHADAKMLINLNTRVSMLEDELNALKKII